MEPDAPERIEPEQSALPGPEATPAGPIGPQIVERFMATFSAGMHGGPDQFIDKLDTTQISQILDQADAESKRAHSRSVLSMSLGFAFAAILVLTIPGLCWIFLTFQKGDLMRELVILLIGVCGGGTIGYGAGRVAPPRGE